MYTTICKNRTVENLLETFVLPYNWARPVNYYDLNFLPEANDARRDAKIPETTGCMSLPEMSDAIYYPTFVASSKKCFIFNQKVTAYFQPA